MKSKPIRLTTTSYALLALLDQLGEATSYEIKQAMEKSIENFWPVPHTTAYEEPARLAGGRLPLGAPGGGGPAPQELLADRGGPDGAARPGPRSRPRRRRRCATNCCSRSSPAPTRGRCSKARVAWHEEKLAELQGYLDEVRGKDEWRPSELTLTAGVGYHRKMLELMERAEPEP